MSNHFISKITKYILYGVAFVSTINIVFNLMQINLFYEYFEENLYTDEVYEVLINKHVSRYGLFSIFYGLIFLLSFFIIGRWFYVSAKINHLSEVKELTTSPRWAVLWYCIPLFSLWKPYQSLTETYKASSFQDDWQSIKTPSVLPAWWLTFVAGNIISFYSWDILRDLELEPVYTDLNLISYLDISADILAILNVIFLFRIVNKISENQKDKNFELNPTT